MAIHSDRPATVSDRLHSGSDGIGCLRVISRDEVRRVLDSDRRREVIRHLLAADGPVEVRTLVGRLADVEDDATFATTILQLRQRVHVSLRRTHLPLLEEHGIVTYDRVRGVVSPGANLPTFESALDDPLEGGADPRLR